ncbi:hypothetical protein BDW59DRAFT_146469 [Aspergillus cavernicola]|uniref:AAA+ ATPase domain-containing protein n=1 Tax=Aspergillus cavernicola TaxID=176166 RepID=A0ABR4IBQ0_9EURO
MYSSMQQGRLLWSLARPCRFVARRRYPAVVPFRPFHLSQTWQSSTPSDPNESGTSASEHVNSGISTLNGEHNLSGPNASSVQTPVDRSDKKESGPYGSALRRALRNKKRSKDLLSPTVTIPDWFRERNTVLIESGNSAAREAQQLVNIRAVVQVTDQPATDKLASGGDGEGPPSSDEQPNTQNRYALTDALWEELCASARAGLRLPPIKYAAEPSARKSHLVLHYPGPDGISFLDAVTKRLAQELGTDLVTLNAQDIAQLCVEQDLADTGKTSAIRLLGYEVYRPSISESWQESSDGLNEEDEADTDVVMPRNLGPGGVRSPKFITIESSRDSGDIPLPNLFGLKSLVAAIGGPSDNSIGTATSQPLDRAEERRLQLVHKLISSPGHLTQQPAVPLTADKESPNDSDDVQPEKSRDIIVQVQDYGDIQNTREGSKFLNLLQKAIQNQRKDGHRVLFIGTAAQDIPQHSDSSRLLQNAFDDQFSQMVVVTPVSRTEVMEKTFWEDRGKRTLDINIRHLQSMLRTRLEENPSAVKDEVLQNLAWPLEPSLLKESGLNERYWSYNQVHWAATLALGSLRADEVFGFEHIRRGIEMIQKTDHVRKEWLQERTPNVNPTETENNSRERSLAALRKTCNTHEKKLLNGVVDAKSIRTTFSDVHVPPETIDALKTLTTLSLIRPEAFTYGVLSTDKIPGLLLYGPPGTGKTMLAKAVARESGATVLEVSGSEVYDMYVGEGEKNVKAIFTLAKKLNPCVVFIDEADAIFCSRTGASSRTSHRELINQFLKEWDGMNDLSTFIMVATNRPFDLDDAVLRRLPRRLLVDLPTEKDRLAILKIHLKEESLDSTVDFAQLAHRTPLYSGSDLKNLCVAAALACVREENALAQQHTGDDAYQYPARRTLTWTHFERGMEEISASINEDMSSLTAIRKFDEQYGDRKGRRKKSPGWGFTTHVGDEDGTDAARVRT